MGGLVTRGKVLRLLKKREGTKTDYSTELVLVDEAECGELRPVLVAHNPQLANRLAGEIMRRQLIPQLSHYANHTVREQVVVLVPDAGALAP